MSSEKFSLKWNDYQSNWSQSLSGLRNDTEMADVTLITDDKVKLFAHKILLSSCSEVFKFILKESKQQSPLLYLSGISSVNLGFILDYIYHGEVNLYQEQLDGFLESAQKLEITGLLGNNESTQDDSNINVVKESVFKEEEENHENSLICMDDNTVEKPKRQYIRPILRNSPQYDVSGMSNEEISAKIQSMYQKIDGVWSCNECGKKMSNMSTDMRHHVETHLDGLCYTCNICKKEFRSKQILKNHKQKNHKNIFQE